MTTARNVHLIITARLISDFGAFLNMVALATYVYLLSNSAAPRIMSDSRSSPNCFHRIRRAQPWV